MSSLYYIRNKKCEGYYTNKNGKDGFYTKIDMTAGGGMGGSSWSLYTKKRITIDDVNKSKFIEFKDISGTKRIVGTNFITEIYMIVVNYDENGELENKYWEDKRRKCSW